MQAYDTHITNYAACWHIIKVHNQLLFAVVTCVYGVA